ncbi:DUF4097 family beta strand repeat-containing protein [Phytohabitans sp. ZYX-F-186]|uniref:DUF4097 family beta strand repeat-containing protein n=1 Tax=Phytohabitans maris TaxID=3071409 RepID=A0ABU0ZJY3_9ACTN|nr:DUF4097 family beta strand repeat-containing protein [Phytohabitans sp. ZYX-F-186]MDQ7907349.1 DUF4097 family beta strand repeat-containing protein [Phytohabitans sp. ZYX-F-186]
MPEFPTPHPVTAAVKLASGALEITAEERDTAVVDVQPYDDRPASHEAAERTTVELRGDTLTVAAPDGGWLARRPASLLITIRVPLDSRLRLKTASADVTCRGRFAGLDAAGASGDMFLEHIAGDAKVRIASGDVTAGQIDGELQVSGAAGDVTAQHVSGPVDTSVASGSIDIGTADSGVRAKTASGGVRIGATRRGTVKVRTASGDVAVGVRSGTGVWLDLGTISGRTTNDLDMTAGDGGAGHDLSVDVRTASGDIAIRRVPAEATAA